MVPYTTECILALYTFFAVFFVFISVKCFFEKISIPKIIITFLLSPVTGYLFSLVIFIDEDIVGSDDINVLTRNALVLIAGQLVVYAILMFLYVKLMKAKNTSLSIFVYMSSITIVPGMFYILSMYSYIPFVLYFLLAPLFYQFVIKQIAELSKTKQITDLRLFIILPAMTGVFNIIMYSVYFFTLQIVNSGQLLEAIQDFKEETGILIKDSMPIFLVLIKYITRSYAVFVYPSIFVSLVLIIAFHVIVKNVKYTNELVKARDEIKVLSVEVMEALAHTIDAKDEYTRGHSIRVARYARMIAERMGLSEEQCENIYYRGLLHDIGKIGVPNEIINKPSKLTDAEYDVIKTHPVTGFDILAEIKSRPDLATGARWHHERFDGTGYPDQKSGYDIPIEARIIAVADSYDAMTSNRSYRGYMSQEKVRSELEKNIGTQFDEKVARCMISIIDEDKDYTMHE